MKAEAAMIMCPSHRCKPGAQLLGIRQSDDEVVILPQPLLIDQRFVDHLTEQGVVPEEVYRFTNKCAEHGCNKWTGEACGVIEEVIKKMEGLAETAVHSDLRPCSIRANCRWYRQRNADACRVCTYVITQSIEEEERTANAVAALL